MQIFKSLLFSLLFSFIASLLLLTGIVSLVIPSAGHPTVQMAGLADWFTGDNVLYLVIIVLGGLITLVSLKYRIVVVELKELFETIRKAYEDDELTDAERKAILAQGLEVVRVLIMLAWKPVGLTAKAIERAVPDINIGTGR